MRSEELTRVARAEQVQRENIPPKRGSILDRNGELLAHSVPRISVFADRNHIRNLKVVLRGLSAAEGVSSSKLEETYTKGELRSRYKRLLARALSDSLGFEDWEILRMLGDKKKVEVRLKRGLDPRHARRLKAKLAGADLGGVDFRDGIQRVYPAHARLSHVLGYVNSEDMGVEGIEKTQNHFLTGMGGARFLERDRKGREIVAFRGRTSEPMDGCHVRLTIDMGLQTILEEELDQAVAQYGPRHATAILIQPFTGEILAMANYPDFDPNTCMGGEARRRNLAVADFFEPGSIFKIVTVAAALDSGLVLPNTLINCHYGHYDDGAEVSLNDHHPYGDLTVCDILVKSSNIGVYKLAKQVGPDRLHDYIRTFGFGRRTGVALTAETAGMVHSSANWSPMSLSRIPMGHEIGVSSMQMVSAMAAVANGGKLMQPKIVHSVVDTQGAEIYRMQPQVVRQVVQPRTAAMLREALVGVVSDEGTARLAEIPGYRVGGKTGTAQRVKAKGRGYERGKYIVSFVGFVPADNPELVGIVVVDDAQTDTGTNYGGTVAAPVFAEIGRRALAYMDIRPTHQIVQYADVPLAAPVRRRGGH